METGEGRCRIFVIPEAHIVEYKGSVNERMRAPGYRRHAAFLFPVTALRPEPSQASIRLLGYIDLAHDSFKLAVPVRGKSKTNI